MKKEGARAEQKTRPAIHILVAEASAGTPQELIDALLRAADEWAGEGPPNDDITFVVLQVR